jgi:hypothetical protein
MYDKAVGERRFLSQDTTASVVNSTRLIENSQE